MHSLVLYLLSPFESMHTVEKIDSRNKRKGEVSSSNVVLKHKSSRRQIVSERPLQRPSFFLSTMTNYAMMQKVNENEESIQRLLLDSTGKEITDKTCSSREIIHTLIQSFSFALS